MKKSLLFMLAILACTALQLGMGRNAVYDEEARAELERQKGVKKLEKTEGKNAGDAAQNFADGVKNIALDNPRDAIAETAEATVEEPPVLGTLEGARRASGKVLDNTVKGAVKVATLGLADTSTYKVTDPKKDTDETTKISFSF